MAHLFTPDELLADVARSLVETAAARRAHGHSTDVLDPACLDELARNLSGYLALEIEWRLEEKLAEIRRGWK